jgi:hypothetical protein
VSKVEYSRLRKGLGDEAPSSEARKYTGWVMRLAWL